MSEFWWGVLALPIIVGGTGAAVCLVFGAWLLIEKWFERRWRKLEPIRFAEVFGGRFEVWTMANLGQRGWLASVLLAGAKGRQLKLGPAALVLIWGKPNRSDTNKINAALTNAMTEVSKRKEKDHA